jgi:protein MAK16
MQNDESIWACIGARSDLFCSFKHKVKTPPVIFCSNENNLTGICTRVTCPLANSQYATVKEDPATGKLYLFTKTPERYFTPLRLWEKKELSPSLGESLKMIDEELLHWPKHVINRVKARLVRIRQVRSRARRLAIREETEMLVPIKMKTVRREKAREGYALQAANIEKSVAEELIDRLKNGMFLNYPLINPEQLNVDQQSISEGEESLEDWELESEMDMEDQLGSMFVEDDQSEDEGEEETVEKETVKQKVSAVKSKKRKVVEYESDSDAKEYA